MPSLSPLNSNPYSRHQINFQAHRAESSTHSSHTCSDTQTPRQQRLEYQGPLSPIWHSSLKRDPGSCNPPISWDRHWKSQAIFPSWDPEATYSSSPPHSFSRAFLYSPEVSFWGKRGEKVTSNTALALLGQEGEAEHLHQSHLFSCLQWLRPLTVHGWALSSNQLSGKDRKEQVSGVCCLPPFLW